MMDYDYLYIAISYLERRYVDGPITLDTLIHVAYLFKSGLGKKVEVSIHGIDISMSNCNYNVF